MPSKHILIVEDEMLIALDMELTLTQLGHTVTTAATIVDARAAVERSDVDLAIVDYHLRDGKSSELAAELVEKKVPFIVCSGSAGVHELHEIFGSAEFLPKPFSEDGLLAAIAKVSQSVN